MFSSRQPRPYSSTTYASFDELVPPLAKYMRSGKDGRQFMVQGWKEEHEFEPGTVFHLREADLHQEVYGLPEWISALQSALLNESATLFRRKYYENGTHAGFILYMTDAAQNEADVDSLRKALKDSKGPGNFRNLFVYSPNGKKDGLQIIPVSEVTAKDEFNSIKNQTRDDVLASLRIPPQLMGIVPQNLNFAGRQRGETLIDDLGVAQHRRSVKTVSTQKVSAMRKLEVLNNHALITYCIKADPWNL